MSDVRTIEPNEIIVTPIDGLIWTNGKPEFTPKPDQECCENCRFFRPKTSIVMNRGEFEALVSFSFQGYCASVQPARSEPRWPEVTPWESCGAFKSKIA